MPGSESGRRSENERRRKSGRIRNSSVTNVLRGITQLPSAIARGISRRFSRRNSHRDSQLVVVAKEINVKRVKLRCVKENNLTRYWWCRKCI
jgi:hypothetical protein